MFSKHFKGLKVIVRGCASTTLNVKPFEQIPGPPGKGWPFFGHMNLIFGRPHGFGKNWLNYQEMFEKYNCSEAKLLRCYCPILNPTNGNIVALLDSSDIEVARRNEGKYPNRGPAFDPYKLMRQKRPDVFPDTTGVLMENGELWHDIRIKVQQDLMRPQSAYFYLDEIQAVGQEFIDFIRQKRTKNDHIIRNCLPEIYKYTFESICLIALDTRLGCLKIPLDPELETTFEASKNLIEAFGGLLKSPSWMFFPPRWNKVYRNAEDSFEILLNFQKEQVEKAQKRIASKSIEHVNEMSVLEKMITRCGAKSSYPLVMAIDMMFAGIDTTGNTLGFLMYFLATNPDKQEILRKECQSLGKTLQVSDLNKLRYLKACISETNRLAPTIATLARETSEDLVLRGYQIPKGTQLVWSIFFYQNQFKDHDRFMPERWLNDKSEICPYAVKVFGLGPRMCIGKRFAELELLTVTHKIMSNFRIKWMHEEPMTISQVLINEPDQSLDFQFTDL